MIRQQSDASILGHAGISGSRRAVGSTVVDAPSLLLPLHIVLLSLAALACSMALTRRLYEPEASHDSIALVGGFGVIALMGYVRYVLRRSWVSPPMVYLLLFWMFHFGLTFTAVLVPQVLTEMDPRAILWLYSPNVRMSMLLSLLGAVGFVFGVGLMTLRPATAERSSAHHDDDTHDSVVYAAGWLVMLLGLAIWAVIILRNGGLGVFALEYDEFRSTVSSPTGLFTFVQVSQLGCLLALAGARRRQLFAPFALWAAFASILLLLGLRGQAMIPILTFVIILIHRRVRFSRGLLVGGALIALVLIPAIKTIRTVGFSNRSSISWTEMSPLGTFTELGSSLRAVKAYVDWIEQGDQYLLGASYWAPVDRHLLVWIVPGRKRIPADEDLRVPAQQMSAREGPVGTAATGEAYYNFGAAGPFIYFGMVGALFGWLSGRVSASPYGWAILGTVMFLFYWNIRGQWIHIPAQAAAALILLGLCRLFRRSDARPPLSARC